MGPSRPSIFLLLFLSVVVCMSASLGSSSSDLVESELLKVPISEFANSVRSTINVVQQVASLVSRSAGAFGDFRLSNAIADCLDLLDLSADELTRTLSASQSPNGTYGKHNSTGNLSADLRTWLSGALGNQDTCIEGFDGTNSFVKNLVAGSLNQLTSLIQDILLQVRPLPDSKANNHNGGGGGGRKLKNDDDPFPYWIKSKDRKLLQSNTNGNGVLVADVVVAADGSGNFSKVMDAISAAPEYSSRRYVVYVKKGVYNEYVEISKKKWNLMMIGDGIDVTVISGNRSFIDGWTTYRSATFAVKGQGFLARDMTFENTAGPQKHQAVAFRSDSDLSVLFRCAIRGFQDTLYAHSLRQFYRECQITGTVDFIFGDGTVVFQNCQILARLGLPDQKNTITAQGRTDPSQSTGFSIQFSNISAEPDLLASLNSTYTYLGRPWKLYSRTVIMQSYMSNAIRQEGWLEWNGNFALDTLFYGEFMNNGPGAGLGSRVKWPGFQPMNDSAQAYNFSVGQFILGNDWLPSIQNGNLAHFWEAKWVPSTKDFKIASHKPPHCTVQTVAEVIDPNRKIWKRELLKEWLSPEDLEAALAIPIAAVNRDDLLMWHHNPSGVYSVTSGYALAKQICHNSNGSNKPSGSLTLGTDFWNSIWALDIPPKICHFWWRVCHNLSATKLGLFRCKCASSGECPICRKDDESVEHLLFDCPWTKAVWFGSDNKSVISLCVSETVPPWEYSAIILDIRGLASSTLYLFPGQAETTMKQYTGLPRLVFLRPYL